MPYTIVQRDDKFFVHKADESKRPVGQPLGRHDSREEAIAQIGAIESAEAQKSDKFTQEETDYQEKSTGDQKCGNCRWFNSGADPADRCQVVEGTPLTITAGGVSNQWAATPNFKRTGSKMTFKSLDGQDSASGHLVTYTNPKARDLDGDYFDKTTYFMKQAGFAVVGRPVMYEHAMLKQFGSIPVGIFELENEDEIGLFVQARLHQREDYERMLREICARRGITLSDDEIYRKSNLFYKAVRAVLSEVPHQWSLGSYPPLYVTDENGHVEQCGIVEGSLTVQPAEPLGTEAMMSFQKSISQALNLARGDSETELRGQKQNTEIDQIDQEKENPIMNPEVIQAIEAMLQKILSMVRGDESAKQLEDEELQDEMAKAAEELIEEEADEVKAELMEVDEDAKKAEGDEEEDKEKVNMKRLEQWGVDNFTAIITRALENADRKRNDNALAVRKAAQKGLAGHRPTSKRERAGAFRSSAGGSEERSGASKTFKNINVSSGFAKRVDATPTLMHIKSQSGMFNSDPDVIKYKRHHAEEESAYRKTTSALIGASLAYLGTPALREELIDQLRPKTFLDKVGARFTFVDGNQQVDRPKITVSPKGVWLGENDTVPEDEYTAQLIQATPKPVAGHYALPIALMERMMPSDEATLRDELMKSIALAINEAALRGTGNINTGDEQSSSSSTGAQPLGLLPSLPSAQKANLSTNGRAPTPADMKAMKAGVEDRDVELSDGTHWVYHTNVLNYFEDLTDTTGQLIQKSQYTKGYDPVTSNIVETDLAVGTGTNLTRIYFGDWRFFEVVQSRDIRLVLFNDSVFVRKLQVGIMAYTYVDFLIHQIAAFEARQAVKV